MKYINLHTHHFTDNSNITEIVNQFPNEFEFSPTNYSVGIHPWHINEKFYEAELTFIENKISELNCLAVGECGLDKRIEIPMALQITVFEKQIALAEKYQKPLILHLAAAFGELLSIKKRLNITVPIIIHGFSKNEQVTKQLLANRFYLSFGKYLLRNPELKKVFQMMPNDRIFLETDTIEETITEVYNVAADFKGMTLLEMQKQIKANWNTVFINQK